MKQQEQKNNFTLWVAVAVIAVVGAFGVLWYQEAQEKEKALREARLLMTEAQRKQRAEDQKTALVLDTWLRTQFRDADWFRSIERISLTKGHAKVQTKLETTDEGRSLAQGAADAVWQWAQQNRQKYQVCCVSVLANDQSPLYERRFEMQFKIPQPPMG